MRSLGFLLLLAPLVAGCGQELTAGGYDGEVETVVVDEPAPGSSSTPSQLRGSRFYLAPQISTAPSGTVEIDASAVLVAADGSTVPLTDGRRGASLAIAASDSATLDFRAVAAIRYQAVRVTFHRVTANLSTSLLLGPFPVTGVVGVDLQQPVVVERPIDLTVTAGGAHSLIVDLNSLTWLATANPTLRTVSAASFAAAVEVRVD